MNRLIARGTRATVAGMRDPHRLRVSAARAAAVDFLGDAGLAAPDLDPTRTGDVIAERAAAALGAEGMLGAHTDPCERERLLDAWARHYIGAVLQLQGDRRAA